MAFAVLVVSATDMFDVILKSDTGTVVGKAVLDIAQDGNVEAANWSPVVGDHSSVMLKDAGKYSVSCHFTDSRPVMSGSETLPVGLEYQFEVVPSKPNRFSATLTSTSSDTISGQEVPVSDGEHIFEHDVKLDLFDKYGNTVDLDGEVEISLTGAGNATDVARLKHADDSGILRHGVNVGNNTIPSSCFLLVSGKGAEEADYTLRLCYYDGKESVVEPVITAKVLFTPVALRNAEITKLRKQLQVKKAELRVLEDGLRAAEDKAHKQGQVVISMQAATNKALQELNSRDASWPQAVDGRNSQLSQLLSRCASVQEH